MANIQQFIGRIREQYLLELSREVATYNKTFNRAQIEELVERHIDQTLPPAFKVHRIDMISNSPTYTDFSDYTAQNTLYFRPTKLSLNRQLKIVLEPFAWNAVDIECDPFDSHALLLQQWAYNWIENCSDSSKNTFGLSGCAHSISFPTLTGSVCCFTVDFGSADVKCFIELLQVLYRLGVKKARIFSRAMYQ